ncbi:rho-associated protein kinase 2-like isoform X2 [Crotalus tigris]|uniref:rho-associated protein kinase 2-like isoform X2 n=1 Tax=Crotalus tigris TaxID=88082 RepID=UPI00192F7986|nr:rho-associated protein kinase 2-like isoform X2 [Crotalus tigris]
METFLYYTGKLLSEVCLSKYQERRRKQREHFQELTARHQEELAEKNARITALEEENKTLASNLAHIVKENNEIKKKLQKAEERLAQLTPDTATLIERLRKRETEAMEEEEEMSSQFSFWGEFN